MAYTSTHRHPGEGEELYTADATVTVKCRAAHTGGGYEVFEVDAARGPVVPAHREPWAKAFYVLHGRMAVQAGEASYELGPGAFLTVPPGTANSFEVFSPSVKFLAFSLGTGMGDFFADVDRAAERDASLANLASQLQELAARHHVTFAGPPLVTL
jgi:quercetin dioxygenase-like cupin family protein